MKGQVWLFRDATQCNIYLKNKKIKKWWFDLHCGQTFINIKADATVIQSHVNFLDMIFLACAMIAHVEPASDFAYSW